MESKTKGSFEGWDEIWTNQSTDNVVNPMYTESEPASIYQFWQKGYAEDLIKLVKKHNFNSFCELGSGRGTTTMYLAKEGYGDLTMVDLAEQGFRVAKASFDHYKLPQPTIILENVEKTSLEGNRFDCIYNIGLLEHFDDPAPTLKESFRLLKKGGMIFMPIVPTQPLYKSFIQRLIFNPLSLVKMMIKKLLGREIQPKNINRTDYGAKIYTDICKEIGFTKIACIPYNPYFKTNSDGWFMDNITLPVYSWYYNTFKKGKDLSFKTSGNFDVCILLMAYK
jgi:ubiquinone/menaquinone biosynthesis C-methylase UbiE